MVRKTFIASVVFILLIAIFATMYMTAEADKFSTLPDIISQIEQNESKITALEDMLSSTHELAEAKRAYGMSDDSIEIRNLKQNWDLIHKEQQKIIKETEELKQTKYDIELDILSRVVFAEVGSDGIPDECQRLAAMVVLNRVNSPRYPNDMYSVVFAPLQYACTWDGGFYKTPNERAIRNAKLALDGEVECPKNILGQAGFPQGETYRFFPTKWDDVYFCYMPWE